MNDISKFKTRLKDLRTEYSMTQKELSDKIGIVRTAITNYETGRTLPDTETISKMANIFDTTTDYLLGNSNIRNPYEDEIEELPSFFSTPEQAMKFVLEQNVIMGFGGFDVDKLSDDEVVEFANSLLEHLKLLSLKYKK